ncbi:YkgJ family cysteine cluster protein [Ignavibacterium sp.]|uniref:YkgJ family cysteine cluster protein n=1 Tax=Ignavibacterium sp. TaxID=2651167 RepID=UPI00307E0A10
MENRFGKLEKFYEEVNKLSSALIEKHRDRLKYKAGCFSCCVDNLTVFEVEAEYIKHYHSDLLKKESPYPKGYCSFLNNKGECRIYEHRTYVCRTQALPLRWLEEINEEELVDMRDICPLHEEGEPIVSLKIEDCWTISPFEEKLAEVQNEFNNKPFGKNRIELRNLFIKIDLVKKIKASHILTRFSYHYYLLGAGQIEGYLIKIIFRVKLNSAVESL